MTIEAMKLALEALEKIEGAMPFPVGRSAITALRTAIAEAEKQEPVGKFAQFQDGIWREVTVGSSGVLLYTAPPAAQRQPLTEEEIELLSIKHAPPIHPDFTEDDDFIDFARAIEKAHGIK